MKSFPPVSMLALLAPFAAAGGLVFFDAEYRVPAYLMAMIAAGAVVVVNGQGGGDPERERILESEKDRLRSSLEATEKELAALKASGDKSQASDVDNAWLYDVSTALIQMVDTLDKTLGEQEQIGEQATAQSRLLRAAFSEANDYVERLAKSTEESSSAVYQMTSTTEEMANNIEALGGSVRESVASIEEMTFSIKEVAKNVDALSLTAEETASSMNEMDVSIDQVQSNANETARLSEEVARDAETGAEAILKTIGEIYRIKESSIEAVSVISNLGTRISAIGQILSVIDDVAEQTNLLALNAAIIAAQAGEHGKGFAVVADEIKDLAERSGASTKEIADLIKTIQAESVNAIHAVERGAENVDRGVEVSNEAERALKKILESSQKSTNMVRAIARATVEQAKGSRQVTDSIGRIAETVQQVAAATAEQARGSELIMSSGEKMRTISQHVERAAQEQSRGGHQLAEAIENITALVRQLSGPEHRRGEVDEASVDLEVRLAENLSGQRAVLSKARKTLLEIQKNARP